jgi:hypothetical protein
VRSFDNQPATGISVDLENERGVVHRGKTDERGLVKFCDFGFDEHSIHVTDERCNDITVRKINVSATTIKIVTVLLNHCGLNLSSPRTCFSLVRVRTRRDEPVPGAEMRSDKSKVVFVSNSYGVFHFGVSSGMVLSVAVHAPGFAPAVRELRCEKGEDIKETVVLEKNPTP